MKYCTFHAKNNVRGNSKVYSCSTSLQHFFDKKFIMHESKIDFDIDLRVALSNIAVLNGYVFSDLNSYSKQKDLLHNNHSNVVISMSRILAEAHINTRESHAYSETLSDLISSKVTDFYFINKVGDISKLISYSKYGPKTAMIVTNNDVKKSSHKAYTYQEAMKCILFKATDTEYVSLYTLSRCAYSIYSKTKYITLPPIEKEETIVTTTRNETNLYDTIKGDLNNMFYHDKVKESFSKIFGVRVTTMGKKVDVVEVILSKTGSTWVAVQPGDVVKINAQLV